MTVDGGKHQSPEPLADEFHVSGRDTGAVGEREEPLDPARRFAYWFMSQPMAIQGAFIREWLRQHPADAARLSVNEGLVARTEAEPHE